MNAKILIASLLCCSISATIAELEDGLVSYWTFDEPTTEGSVALDLQGGNDGVFVGAPDTVAGIIGEALEFDGATDAVEVPHPDDGSLDFGAEGDFTISAWIKTAGTGAQTTILSKNDGGNNPRILFKVENAGLLFMTIANESGAGPRVDFRSSAVVTDNEWHHVVMAADRDMGTTAYIDGVLDSAAGVSAGTDITSTSSLTIGVSVRTGGATRRFWDGLIDDVAIWNRTLSAEETAQLYTNGLAGKGVLGGSGTQFAITAIEHTGGKTPEVTIYWNSRTGAHYSVDRSSDLRDWLELDDSIASEGNETSFTDNDNIGASKTLYYRVREP